MPRVSIDNTPAASQALLGQIQQAFGATPNMFKAVANSPAALQSMWAAFGALGKGTLGAKLGMHTRRRDGRFGFHAKVDQVDHRLNHAGDDGGTA